MTIYDNDGNKINESGMSAAGSVMEMPSVGDASTPELSMGYILSQIEKVRSDSSFFQEALKMAIEIPADQPHSHSGAHKAQAIGEIVKQREMTNQRLLKTYEKMYDDLRPARDEGITSEQTKIKMLEVASQMVKDNEEFAEHFAEHFGEAMRELFKN